MICPKWGGNFSLNQNCERCNTPYSEIIEDIRHDEMKRLFLKMDELMESHKSIEIEESLLACELINSSLLVPITIIDDSLSVLTVKDKKRNYILLFTDKEEYDKNNKDIPARTNPFRTILDLMDDHIDGFIINIASVACEIPRKYLEKYFLGDS